MKGRHFRMKIFWFALTLGCKLFFLGACGRGESSQLSNDDPCSSEVDECIPVVAAPLNPHDDSSGSLPSKRPGRSQPENYPEGSTSSADGSIVSIENAVGALVAAYASDEEGALLLTSSPRCSLSNESF